MRRDRLVRVWLAALCGVAGLTAFFGVNAKSAAPQALLAKPMDLDAEEIIGLIVDLENPDRTTREEAYKTLFEIGQPTLRHFRSANLHKHPNAVPLAFELYRAIQKKHGLGTIRRKNDPPPIKNLVGAIRCQGLEFTPVGSVDWKLPEPGKKIKVDMGVKVVNTTGGRVRFPAHVTYFHFARANFEDIIGGGGREGGIFVLNPGEVIEAGKQISVRDIQGNLEVEKDGNSFMFYGAELGNGFYQYYGLKPGGYFVKYVMSNNDPHVGEVDPPFWTGEVRTDWVAITIR